MRAILIFLTMIVVRCHSQDSQYSSAVHIVHLGISPGVAELHMTEQLARDAAQLEWQPQEEPIPLRGRPFDPPKKCVFIGATLGTPSLVNALAEIMYYNVSLRCSAMYWGSLYGTELSLCLLFETQKRTYLGFQASAGFTHMEKSLFGTRRADNYYFGGGFCGHVHWLFMQAGFVSGDGIYSELQPFGQVGVCYTISL